LISIHNVSFSYTLGGLPVLHEVSVQVGNEMVAVLGANGSGKSTLARLMNGLLLPTRGSVSVDGYATADMDAWPEIRRRVGMVFQSPENQIVSSSVDHDVAFGLENLCMDAAEMRQRVDDALIAVDLDGRGDENPHNLSSSEKQRLAVAGALAVGPAYLILDEATSFLDGADRQDLLAAVVRLRQRGDLGIIMITHLMEEALLCDRVVVMAEGHIVFDGLPRDLFAFEPERLAAWRLQTPALVTLASRLRDARIALPAAVTTADALVSALCS